LAEKCEKVFLLLFYLLQQVLCHRFC